MRNEQLRITTGYTAFNGHVFSAAEADAYNRHCQTIETLEARLQGAAPSPQAKAEIDFFLDQRARLFKAITGAQ